jgi:hypothetical protein
VTWAAVVIGALAGAGAVTGLLWPALQRARRRVAGLQEQLSASEASSSDREQREADRAREMGAVLEGAVERGVHDLDDVRLPLQILLENHFGELNDNQLELVGAARDAADVAAGRLRRARDLLALQPAQLRHEAVRAGEILSPLIAVLQSRGAARQVRVVADIVAPLPVIRGDPIRLQEALSLVASACLAGTADGGTLHIAASAKPGELGIAFDGGRAAPDDIDTAWAARVVTAHGGSLRALDARVDIRLPRFTQA